MRLPEAVTSPIIICDDVRIEVGAKYSAMGIYGPVMEVPTLPFSGPSLCVVLQLLRLSPWPRTVTWVLLGPDGREVAPVTVEPIAPPIDPTDTNLMVAARISPMLFEKSGNYLFRFYFDEPANDTGYERAFEVRLPRNPG